LGLSGDGKGRRGGARSCQIAAGRGGGKMTALRPLRGRGCERDESHRLSKGLKEGGERVA